MSKPKKSPTPKKPKEVTQFDSWVCQLCGADATSGPSISAHLTEAHDIPAGQKYSRTMIRHVDATTWYQSDYTYKIEEKLIITRSVRNPRGRASRGYWE